MRNHFCNFSVEWLTDCIQTNAKSCKIGLTQKFKFEVITAKVFFQTNPRFSRWLVNLVAFKLYENNRHIQNRIY